MVPTLPDAQAIDHLFYFHLCPGLEVELLGLVLQPYLGHTGLEVQPLRSVADRSGVAEYEILQSRKMILATLSVPVHILPALT